MRALLIHFSLIVGLLPALSAIPLVDSLSNLLQKSQDIQERSVLYSQLAEAYQYENIDTAFMYARLGLEEARKQAYSEGIALNARTLADLYIVNDQLDEAKGYYAEAVRYFQESGNVFEATWTSMVIGNIFLAQDQYSEALQRYQEALKISKEQDFQSLLPHLLNNLGVLYLKLNEYDEAQPYFEQAHVMFVEQGDPYSAAHSLSNLAEILYANGNETGALKNYFEIVPVFLELKSWSNIARTYDAIAEIYLASADYDQAREYLNRALNILETNSSNFAGPLSIFSTNIYTNQAQLRYHERNYPQALAFARRSLSQAYANSYQKNIVDNALLISEIFEQLGRPDSALAYFKIYDTNKDGLQNEDNLKKITRLEMQYEFEATLQKNELENVKRTAAYKQKESIYLILIVFGLLSAVILVLLYFNQKNKTAKAVLRKENLELEKEKLNQELEYKKKELTTNMIYLLEKNEFILSIARKLDELKTDVKKDDRAIVQQIVNELKRNTSQKAWKDFEMRFMDVHAEFYERLNQQFPNLSPNEQKLCAFLHLNMTSKEISAITHQSVKSINQARFRLRKKMDMERDENLISFLTQL